jgi:hypothetical protein
MNAFVTHHQDSIRFSIPALIVFSSTHRSCCIPPAWSASSKDSEATALTPASFRSISTEYHQSVQTLAAERRIEIVEPPKEVRREDWVEPFFQRLRGQPGIGVILKSRENARVAVSFPKQGNHIELLNRFVWQYYFYLQDRDFGRMFIRVCPYFPFNCRICINGHEWLACRLREEGIRFQQCGNAFRNCADPDRLQALSDSFSPKHILACAHRWLAQLVPFFTDRERRHQGFGYRLFVSQVEYCNNLIFERRAALDRLHERLLDLNRTIGAPDKMAVIFGRRIPKHIDAGLKTQISDHGMGQPIIRSEYKSSSIKQYVRSQSRTPGPPEHTPDLGVNRVSRICPCCVTR